LKKSGKKRSRKISGLCPHPAPLPAGEGIFVGDSVLDIPLFIFNAQSTVGDGVLDVPLEHHQSNFGIGPLTLTLSRREREYLLG